MIGYIDTKENHYDGFILDDIVIRAVDADGNPVGPNLVKEPTKEDIDNWSKPTKSKD